MPHSRKCVVMLLGTVAVGLMAAGCNDAAHDGAGDAAQGHYEGDGHDHEGEGGGAHEQEAEVPQDFASGVVQLKDCYETIKVAFEANKPDDAHVPLHDVGGLLSTVVKLARKANLDEQDDEIVTNAIGKMFEAYGKIDGAMHVGQAPDYAAVAEDLDNGMSELEGVIAKQNAEEGS